MADEKDVFRDWHRLFGLLLADFFTNSPFVVEVERHYSQQQQLLDVAYQPHSEHTNSLRGQLFARLGQRALPCRIRWRIFVATS